MLGCLHGIRRCRMPHDAVAESHNIFWCWKITTNMSAVFNALIHINKSYVLTNYKHSQVVTVTDIRPLLDTALIYKMNLYLHTV